MFGVRLRVKLNPGQDRVLKLLNGPQRYTLVYGGSRSGKTFLLCLSILVRALKAPGSRHVIFRFRQNSAWAAIGLDTVPKVAALCNCPLSVNKQEKSISFCQMAVRSGSGALTTKSVSRRFSAWSSAQST